MATVRNISEGEKSRTYLRMEALAEEFAEAVIKKHRLAKLMAMPDDKPRKKWTRKAI